MIETRRLKNVVIFVQTILSFVLSRKIYYKNLKLYLNEKSTFCIKLCSVKMAKTTHRLYYTKIKEAEKNDNKNGKSPCKLLDNAIYGKVMESMKNKLM